jgi:tight adherence protein B
MRARLKVLRMDFKEFLNALIAALQTGRSIENAFIEALKDIAHSMEKETPFVLEMKRICSGINVGEPLEKLMLDFANRSHMEELEYFAEVFSVGKRSGGNLVGMMKHTIRMIQEQMDAEEEIYTVIAEKQMEFQVMCMIPFAMILYLRISAGNLLDNLYGNAIGVLIMTLCLAVYGGCYLYGKRILEIKT